MALKLTNTVYTHKHCNGVRSGCKIQPDTQTKLKHPLRKLGVRQYSEYLTHISCHFKKMASDKEPNPKVAWEFQDLPSAFKSFKAHCDQFMFGGPLKRKSEK